MATFTNLSMASAVLMCCGSQVVSERNAELETILVFNNAKAPEELAPIFVQRQEEEDHDYDTAQLLGWAKQPLDVYWDARRRHWYAVV